MRFSLILTLLFALFAASSFGEDIVKRNVTIQRVAEAPLVDGTLNDSVWITGAWENDFRQFSPDEGALPTQKTEFKIAYDDNFIYVAFRCLDSEPSKISHILTRRDDIQGDRVGVEFDSYNDHITAYCFYTSAAGVKWDYTSSDNNGSDDNWNPIWWVKTSRDGSGWYAEMKIPLSELRFKPAENSSWGFQVGRRIYRIQEVDLWQPMKRNQQGWNANLGILKWNDKMKSKLPLNITPYFVGQLDRFAKDTENPFERTGKDSKLNAGFDAKLGISNNWTADVTVNPDFGQVDADPSQVNLSAYELFQQERRPFFIEGRNIFSYGVGVGDGDLGTETLFYTRRIGRRPHYSPDLNDNEHIKKDNFTRIIGAAKISGRNAKGLSVGILEAVTAREFAKIDDGNSRKELEVEPLTSYSVVRVNQELNNANTQFGTMLTSTIRDLDASQLNYLHRNAITGGVNFLQYFNSKKWSLTFSTYFSRVNGSKEAILNTQEAAGHYFQRPDAPHISVDSSKTSLLGNGGRLVMSKESGRLRMMFCTLWKSPQLEVNDLGFVRSVDDIMPIYWTGYRFTKPKGIMRSASLNLNAWANWTYGGEFKGYGGNVNGGITFKNLWSLSAGSNFNLKQVSVDLLRGGPSVKMSDSGNGWLYLSSDYSKKFAAEAGLSLGGTLSNATDRWIDLSTSITFRPLSLLSISVSPGYFKEDNALQYVTSVDVANQKQYILGTIAQEVFRVSLRVNLSITPDLTLQYWGQPFIATGNYTGFKRADNLSGASFTQRFHTFTANEIVYDAGAEAYKVSEQGHGSYSFDMPNFTTREFLSNMVLRWEYRPGSTIYAVWSQNRESGTSFGKSRIQGDVGDLFREFPHNVFLLKFSYRFGR